MVSKNKNFSRNWLTIIVVILTIFAVLYFANSSNTDLKISETQFVTMMEEGKVSDISFQSGTAKIRLKDSEIEASAFPARYDFYFEFIDAGPLDSVRDFNEKVRVAQETAEADRTPEQMVLASYSLINSDSVTPKVPIITQVMPYIYIFAIVGIGFMIFRMLNSRSGGAPTFGKSRAKLAEKSTIKFSDVAGADEEKEETREIVEFLKNPGKFKQLGARIPKGVLLVGQPGTGKTLLAKAVAGESNVPFFSISGSDFVELYVGVGASRVRDLFETAKRNAPCIIFIDEIDAVGRQRGAGIGGGSDEREQTLNQLLVEMDGFQGNEGIIIMAATNRADILDPALLRPGRFDRQIYVNVPDVKGREGIIAIHARNKPIDKDVDFKEVARLTSGATGADIENFLNEAAILAARDNRLTITMEDITEGINKALMGPQKKSRIVSERDKKITAYHEAGHAIVGKLLKSGYSVHEVSIIPRGMAGGYTSFKPSDDDRFITEKQALNRIASIMGGRAAEEIIFEDITAGASSDIVSATRLARTMVTEWGMSKEIGFVSLGNNNEVFLGRDYQVQTTHSESTASTVDKEVKRILDETYEIVVKLLKDNIDILHNMSNLLLEKETIYSDEVDKIMAGANYQDIIKEIDKKDRARKRKEARKRKAHDEEKDRQIKQLKLRAAEALTGAGVLSAEDLEAIRQESKQEAPKATETKTDKTSKDTSKKTKTSEKPNKPKTKENNKKEDK